MSRSVQFGSSPRHIGHILPLDLRFTCLVWGAGRWIQSGLLRMRWHCPNGAMAHDHRVNAGYRVRRRLRGGKACGPEWPSLSRMPDRLVFVKTGGKGEGEIQRNLRVEQVEHLPALSRFDRYLSAWSTRRTTGCTTGSLSTTNSDGSLVSTMSLSVRGRRNQFNAQP